MPKFRLNKLVRDKVVQLCLDDPLITETNYHVLGQMEYKQALKDKIFEEGEEIPVREVRDEEVLSEIADLQTVLDHLRDAYEISEEEVRQAQADKSMKKGAFKNQHFIDTVICDDKSPWTADFRSCPEKYPEIRHDEK